MRSEKRPAIKSAVDPFPQARVIAQVVTLLNAHGYCAWRQENNGRVDAAAAATLLLKLYKALPSFNYNDEKILANIKRILNESYRPVPCSLLGVPDIIGFSLETGKWIAVEVKLGEDVWRDNQRIFAERLKASGGDFWLCRDFPTFSTAFLNVRYSKQVKNV